MKRPSTLQSAHQLSQQEADRESDRQRGSSTQRGYDGRWRKARLVHLDAHPLCVMCAEEGRVTAATIVDHIVPHRGDRLLFWDASNWQSLCARHHDSDKQSHERNGRRGVSKP